MKYLKVSQLTLSFFLAFVSPLLFTGPVVSVNNYMIDPLKRINQAEIMHFIDN